MGQTARTMTPAQKIKNHHLKEEPFVVDRTMSVKQLVEEQVLQLFLTGLLLQSIITQSNNFAASKGATLDLRSEELLAFIGMNIAMGLL